MAIGHDKIRMRQGASGALLDSKARTFIARSPFPRIFKMVEFSEGYKENARRRLEQIDKELTTAQRRFVKLLEAEFKKQHGHQ